MTMNDDSQKSHPGTERPSDGDDEALPKVKNREMWSRRYRISGDPAETLKVVLATTTSATGKTRDLR